MITVTLPDRTLAIVFSHFHVISFPPNSTAGVKVRATRCELFELDAVGRIILPRLSKGESKCSPLDNFIKAVGRKIALTRALMNADDPFAKADRTAIWDAYWRRG